MDLNLKFHNKNPNLRENQKKDIPCSHYFDYEKEDLHSTYNIRISQNVKITIFLRAPK